MKSPRSQKIQAIIDARKPMALKVNATQELLSQVESCLHRFKSEVSSIANAVGQEDAPLLAELVPQADKISERIVREKYRLSLLHARFSRATLNVGVVGLARQGKSTFIQNLTGLGASIVPSGSDGHCTGAPSTVVHHDSDETFAKVEFHSEASFLKDVVSPFFERLRLGIPPFHLDGFQALQLPTSPTRESEDKATDVEHLKKLRFMQENLQHYRMLLTGEVIRLEKNDIRGYIAQDDEKGKRVDNRGVPFCKWVAVKHAHIHCKFPQDDIGTIALADTPGLGDFVSGAEDRLVQTVGKNLDCVAFLRRPEPQGGILKPGDTNLYSLISRAIPDVSLEDWSYYLVNHSSSGPWINTSQVIPFRKSIEESGIKTRRLITVDCASSAEVAACLNEILDDVADNLGSIDEKLFRIHAGSVTAIASELIDLANTASMALPGKAYVAEGDVKLNELFDDTWDGMALRLETVAQEYKVVRDEPHEGFRKAVDLVFEQIANGPKLPSPEKIKREAAAPGLSKWQLNYMHKLRVEMTSMFQGLDESLDESYAEMRQKVEDALMSDDGGRLGNLECPEGMSKLQNLKEYWQAYKGGDVVVRAIDVLMQNSLSFRGFIQPRIRQCLDALDPDSLEAENYKCAGGDTPEIAAERLSEAWKGVGYRIRQPIEALIKEPSMAMFASVEDFADSLLRAGGVEQAKQRWKVFFGQNFGEIWKSEFEALEVSLRMRKRWDAAVQQIVTLSDKLNAI